MSQEQLPASSGVSVRSRSARSGSQSNNRFLPSTAPLARLVDLPADKPLPPLDRSRLAQNGRRAEQPSSMPLGNAMAREDLNAAGSRDDFFLKQNQQGTAIGSNFPLAQPGPFMQNDATNFSKESFGAGNRNAPDFPPQPAPGLPPGQAAGPPTPQLPLSANPSLNNFPLGQPPANPAISDSQIRQNVVSLNRTTRENSELLQRLAGQLEQMNSRSRLYLDSIQALRAEVESIKARSRSPLSQTESGLKTREFADVVNGSEYVQLRDQLDQKTRRVNELQQKVTELQIKLAEQEAKFNGASLAPQGITRIPLASNGGFAGQLRPAPDGRPAPSWTESLVREPAGGFAAGDNFRRDPRPREEVYHYAQPASARVVSAPYVPAEPSNSGKKFTATARLSPALYPQSVPVHSVPLGQYSQGSVTNIAYPSVGNVYYNPVSSQNVPPAASYQPAPPAYSTLVQQPALYPPTASSTVTSIRRFNDTAGRPTEYDAEYGQTRYPAARVFPSGQLGGRVELSSLPAAVQRYEERVSATHAGGRSQSIPAKPLVYGNQVDGVAEARAAPLGSLASVRTGGYSAAPLQVRTSLQNVLPVQRTSVQNLPGNIVQQTDEYSYGWQAPRPPRTFSAAPLRRLSPQVSATAAPN